ncbi:MAG: hypothetical protein MI921_07120 [Cytophagales bacterium]|nr:hypothetical protein [Cytophagales bacterium]
MTQKYKSLEDLKFGSGNRIKITSKKTQIFFSGGLPNGSGIIKTQRKLLTRSPYDLWKVIYNAERCLFAGTGILFFKAMPIFSARAGILMQVYKKY